MTPAQIPDVPNFRTVIWAVVLRKQVRIRSLPRSTVMYRLTRLMSQHTAVGKGPNSLFERVKSWPSADVRGCRGPCQSSG